MNNNICFSLGVIWLLFSTFCTLRLERAKIFQPLRDFVESLVKAKPQRQTSEGQPGSVKSSIQILKLNSKLILTAGRGIEKIIKKENKNKMVKICCLILKFGFVKSHVIWRSENNIGRFSSRFSSISGAIHHLRHRRYKTDTNCLKREKHKNRSLKAELDTM